MSAPRFHIVLSRMNPNEGGDCTICALAMYLEASYEDVVAAAAQVTKDAHRKGMWVSQIIATAKQLKRRLRQKRTWDPEDAFGILVLGECPIDEDHVVLLCEGKIYDMDGSVWDYDDYLKKKRYKALSLLT